jgi:hypothetical protein
VIELDLAAFAAATRAKAPEWERRGITWQMTFGPPRDKSAAWVDCQHSDRFGHLIVWPSGEAELAIVSLTTDDPYQVHYDLTSPDEIATCLRDLTQRLTQPEPAP